MGTAVGMGVAVSVDMDVGGILATFVSAWLLGVGLDCIVPTPGAVAVGSGVAVGVGSGVFAAPRAMVGGATLNGSVAGTVGRVERVWGAWTGPLGVSGVDGAGCAADCGVPLQAAARRVRMGRTETTSRTLFVPNAENPPEMYTGASYSLMALNTLRASPNPPPGAVVVILGKCLEKSRSNAPLPAATAGSR